MITTFFFILNLVNFKNLNLFLFFLDFPELFIEK